MAAGSFLMAAGRRLDGGLLLGDLGQCRLGDELPKGREGHDVSCGG
jgi:hypothetical protein